MFFQKRPKGTQVVFELIPAGSGTTIAVLTDAVIFPDGKPHRLVIHHGVDDQPKWVSEKELDWFRTGRLDKRKA